MATLSSEPIAQYRRDGVPAAEGAPCSRDPLPGRHEGPFVRAGNPHRGCTEDYEIEVPGFPKTFFFARQSERERVA